MTEREFIDNYFANQGGRFLDVGAYDGDTNSLTTGLVNAGWEGVYCEADPLNFARLLDIRHGSPRLRFVHAAILPKGGLVEFWNQIGGGEWPSSDPNHVTEFEERGGRFREFIAAAVSPDTLLDYIEHPNKVRFLNIDIEGRSVELFASWPLARMTGLEMVSVETDCRPRDIEPIGAPFGFRLALETPVNVILTRKVEA